MRATTLAAGGLACAGAAITIAAFAGEGHPQPAPVRAERGPQVFAEQGCGSCHAFEPAGSSGPIGPDLTLSLTGKPREYVIESIVLPDKEAPPGYVPGGMPGDYAKRIAPDDLEALATFLTQGAG